MFKTFYISMDCGETFRRWIKDKELFMQQMWTMLKREIYPINELSVRRETIEINIREPTDMRKIHTCYVTDETTLEQLWELIKEMWCDIELNC